MKKIPTLFVRDFGGNQRLVTTTHSPGTEWVVNGEGIATTKVDGIAYRVHGGQLFKRYDVKGKRTPPPDFEPCQDRDEITGHWPGWVPVDLNAPAEWMIKEALKWRKRNVVLPLFNWTYELVGPKVGTRSGLNTEGYIEHVLIPHGYNTLHGVPVDYEGLRDYLEHKHMEGVVWHHPDGRMAKIKKTDFGFTWGTL